MPFETLQQVPWSKYEHADGPGTDVPKWIEALASSDAKARKRGFEGLSNYVNHQGTAEPVAFEVVPFLVELVREKGSKDVDRLLFLLAQFSVAGNHVNFLRTGFEPALAESWQLTEGITLADLRARVMTGGDAYVTRLKDRAAGVRANAALLLAFLPELSDSSLPALRAQLGAESSDAVRGSLVLALGLLGRGAKLSYDELFAEIQADAGGVVDACLAIARLWLEPQAATKAFLEETFHKATALGEIVKGLPWNGGFIGHIAMAAALGALTASGDASGLIVLADVVGVRAVADPFLSVLFPKRHTSNEPLTRADLTPQQIAGLRVLLEVVKKQDRAISGSLAAFGLLSDWCLSRMLGITEPGPQDREFDGVPTWLVARRVLYSGRPVSDWESLVERLAPEEAAELAQDMTPYRYDLIHPWPPPFPETPYPLEIEGFAKVGKLIRIAAERAGALNLAKLIREAKWGPAASLAVLARHDANLITEDLEVKLLEAVNGTLSDVPNVHDALAALPLPRREAILLRANFDQMLASTTPFDDGPQVIVWRNAWPFVDLCPTEPFARKVVAAMTLFQSELNSPRAPEIEAFALEKLASLKSAVIPVLKETLPKTTNKLQRKIFETALARAEAS